MFIPHTDEDRDAMLRTIGCPAWKICSKTSQPAIVSQS